MYIYTAGPKRRSKKKDICMHGNVITDNIMQPTRRSTRVKRKWNYAQGQVDVPNYPEGNPKGILEEMVALLNQQSFPFMSFGRVDDMLVYSLFASKRHPKGYRAIKPASFAYRKVSEDIEGGGSILESEPLFTLDNGLILAQLFNMHLKGTLPQQDSLTLVSGEIMQRLPHLFQQSDRPILEQ